MDEAQKQFAKYSDRALTVALLAAAGVIVAIALWRHHPLFKAITLAWITLP